MFYAAAARRAVRYYFAPFRPDRDCINSDGMRQLEAKRRRIGEMSHVPVRTEYRLGCFPPTEPRVVLKV